MLLTIEEIKKANEWLSQCGVDTEYIDRETWGAFNKAIKRAEEETKLMLTGRNRNMLHEMLKKQSEFSERIVEEHQRYRDMTQRERLKGLSNFLIDEALEMKNALGYMYNDEEKWWKTTIDYDDVKEEYMDIIHVVLQIALELGLNADAIFNAYNKKMNVNIERQEDGY